MKFCLKLPKMALNLRKTLTIKRGLGNYSIFAAIFGVYLLGLQFVQQAFG